jgi:hypothetical protein
MRSIDERIFRIFIAEQLRKRVLDQTCDARIRAQIGPATASRRRSRHIDDTEGQANSTSQPRSTDWRFAEAMADVARIRVALDGEDLSLLRWAIHTSIERIDLWFGPHPRVRGATTMTRGIVRLKWPCTDSVSGTDTFEFTRQEFDRDTELVKAISLRRRTATGQFVAVAPSTDVSEELPRCDPTSRSPFSSVDQADR